MLIFRDEMKPPCEYGQLARLFPTADVAALVTLVDIVEARETFRQVSKSEIRLRGLSGIILVGIANAMFSAGPSRELVSGRNHDR
jgi:hypothetical protein